MCISCSLVAAHSHPDLLHVLTCPPGVVRTALPDMDRETQDRYQLIIQAKDMMGQMGGLSGTTMVTVTLTDVNDNPPRFPRSESDL